MGDPRQAPPLPTLRPRQRWLIELGPVAALCGLDRNAIISANVVIYDRPLAGVVAEVLPPVSCAEPLSFPCQESGRALSPRALRFAAEGWSVVQLVEASPCWRARLQQAPGEWSGATDAEDAVVRRIAKQGAERYQELRADLDNVDHSHPMTVIFGPIAPPSAAPPYPFTANGLAG